MTAHSASMPDTANTVRRCRICGMVGPLVSPGLYQKRDGRYIKIDRCSDHLACDSRKAAL